MAMSIFGRRLHGPTTVIVTVLLATAITAGTPTVASSVVSAAGNFSVEHPFFLPTVAALVGMFALGGGRLMRRLREAFSTLRLSSWARFSSAGLGSLLGCLLVGQRVEPGFTDFWGFQIAQILMVLLVVLGLSIWLARDGGLSGYTHVAVLATVWIDALGNALHLYTRLPFYDKITHFSSGVVLTAIAVAVLGALTLRGSISLSFGAQLVLAALFTLVVNVGWETYEYVGDIVFQTGRHQSSVDTFYDFVSDMTGALVTLILLWRFHPDRQRHFHRAVGTARAWHA
jgi:uncharacterized membrane protein YjdF